MGAFLETIAASTGLPFQTVMSSFKIIMLSDKSIYVEGTSKISSYHKEEVNIAVKGGFIIITGEDLKIKEYNKNDVLILGTIKSINFV